MDLYIWKQDKGLACIIDSYESLIWTKRYFNCGDFELYLVADEYNLSNLKIGYYVEKPGDDTLMIIEKIEVTTDIDAGNYLIVSGRSIGSILDRRIIWNQTNFENAYVEAALRSVVRVNCIDGSENGSMPHRAMPLYLGDQTSGLGAGYTAQMRGENVLDWVVETCTAYDIGWRMRFTKRTISLTAPKQFDFYFEAYKGTDRSTNQTAVKPIIFSADNDNLINSVYSTDRTNFKNVALALDKDDFTQSVNADKYSGLNRYEMCINVNNISDNSGSISRATYAEMLKARGKEKLSDHRIIQAFSGNILADEQYKLNGDYFLGDIVTIENEYGIKANARIVETIESDSEQGHETILTFTEMEVF